MTPTISRRATASMVAATIVLGACTPTARVDDADPHGALTTTLWNDGGLDPQIVGNVVEIANVMMVFEPPLRLDPKTLRPVPGAAKALPDISADGLTYRLTIRDDSMYSDGTPVRARDFAYGFSRLCDPAIKGPYASIGYVVVGCAEWSSLDPAKDPPEKQRAAKGKLTTRGVRATGENELTITLTEPAAYFSSVLSLWVFAPVRESDVTRGGETWTEPATYIGNGPFVLTVRKPGERYVFTPNRHYRTPSKLTRWTKLVITEPAVALNAYRHDEIDAFTYNGFESARVLREIESNIDLLKESTRLTGSCTNVVGFNQRRPPFDDPAVRLAFAKAIDRDAYVRDLLGGLGSPTLSFIPPGLPGYDKDDIIQRFDATEARRLLASSRYAVSDALRSIVIPHNLQVAPRARAEWLRDHWRANLGVEITTRQMDGPSVSQLYRKPETVPQIFFIGWCADYPDQQDWLSLLFHSSSQAGWAFNTGFSDPDFDRLVSEADRTGDQARRDDLYRKASRMLSERAVLGFFYNSQNVTLRKPWVRGVVDSPLDPELGAIAGPERIYVSPRGR